MHWNCYAMHIISQLVTSVTLHGSIHMKLQAEKFNVSSTFTLPIITDNSIIRNAEMKTAPSMHNWIYQAAEHPNKLFTDETLHCSG
jgi:hypothetical protein